MSDFAFASLVDTSWLAEHLSDPHVKPVDGSWYMPAEARDGRSEFEIAHIPGAVFFDIDAIADTAIPLPHMFPSAQQFSDDVGELGISNQDHVIAYGGNQMSACRVWWMFKAFGHDKVSVLDGCFTTWNGEGRPIESGPARPEKSIFNAHYNEEMVRTADHLRRLIAQDGADQEQILDARSAGRFSGRDPEPRPELPSGHMPGAFNLPFGELLTADQRFRTPDELAAAFTRSGIDPDKPVIASCGSGMSAAVLLFALGRLGHHRLSLYDGSWTEWASLGDAPIETA